MDIKRSTSIKYYISPILLTSVEFPLQFKTTEPYSCVPSPNKLTLDINDKNASSKKILKRSGISLKKYGYSHLLLDMQDKSEIKTNIKKTNMLMQKPFPLLKLLSNISVPNKTQNFLQSLVSDHIERISVDKLKKIEASSASNSDKLNKVTEKELTRNIKNDLNVITISYLPELNYRSAGKFNSLQENQILHSKRKIKKSKNNIEINPNDNYARNAYKFCKIEENEILTNKIKKHIETIKKRKILIRKSNAKN